VSHYQIVGVERSATSQAKGTEEESTAEQRLRESDRIQRPLSRDNDT
jgi:hypothetical protein